jgi:hypothetical protein
VTEKRVPVQGEARNIEVEGEIGTLNQVLTGPVLPEVEVDKVTDLEPRGVNPNQRRMVQIRVNEDIENMSYVASNQVERYTFEAGHRYSVPVEIARELESLGKIWH